MTTLDREKALGALTPSPHDETRARRGFWSKLVRVAGRVPFAEELVTAWYCALDPATPSRVKATLFAALAYFVTPTDFVPDFIVALGFTDDATVALAALGLVATHVKQRHRMEAREALDLPPLDIEPQPADPEH